MTKYIIIIFVAFKFFNVNAQDQTLEDVMYEAGINKDNLLSVIKHYEDTGEKEKKDAAIFLIKNISIHKSKMYKWVDYEGKSTNFSELDYDDFNLALQAFAKLADSIGIRRKKIVLKDIDVITSKTLIRNIDSAFVEWKSNPWSKFYSFDVFCEYILPYRSLFEPLNDWRDELSFLVREAKFNLMRSDDPVELCTEVVNQLEDFSFLANNNIPAPLLSTQQLLFRREGTCPDLANLALLASRSIGIAVTFDFTPHYASSSNRHYWNTVIDKQGNNIPFNGSSANDEKGTPYNYDPNIKRMGKVIRYTYSIQSKSLANKIDIRNIPSSYLRNKNIIDVTKDYVSVGNIIFDQEDQPNDSIAYISVFNKDKWRVIDWGKKEKGYYKFTDLGRDIVYLPCFYSNNKLTNAKYPILLEENGKQKKLKPDHEQSFSCKLTRANEFKNKYQETNSLQIEADEVYSLFYWNRKWIKHGESIANREGVSFNDIPSNALFLLKPLKSDGYERVFTVNPKSQKIFWY